MNRFVNPRGRRRYAFAGAVVAAASLAGFVMHADGTGSAANTHAAATATQSGESCTDRAARARSIAEDRDAGIARQQELGKLQAQWSHSPAERENETMSFLTLLVNGIYGAYARIPARTIYAKYLDYCKTRVPDDADAQ